MGKYFAFILFFLATLTVKAEKVYEFNSTCQQAYQEILKLKLGNGIALIERPNSKTPTISYLII